MLLSELIKTLQEFMEDLGDIQVEVRNEAGDLDFAESITTTDFPSVAILCEE